MRRIALLIALVLASFCLSGCFFFFIPTGAIRETLQEKRYCVPTTAKVGDRVRVEANGRMGTVKEVVGPYSGCKETARPIAVLLTLDEEKVAEKTP